MKNIPEYYQFMEQNQKFVNNYTIKLCLLEKVDSIIFDMSVQSAIERFPYFSVKVTQDEKDGYKFEYNDMPIVISKRESKKLVLASESTNYHLLVIEYDDKNIYFTINHCLAGASGFLNYIKATMFIYF